MKPEPPAKETAKERRAEAKAKKEAAAAKMEKAKSATSGPSGTYLQLAATTQREAEIMVDVLRKKEFKATAAEVPEKPGLFRVLVGPLAEAAVIRTRNDLQHVDSLEPMVDENLKSMVLVLRPDSVQSLYAKRPLLFQPLSYLVPSMVSRVFGTSFLEPPSPPVSTATRTRSPWTLSKSLLSSSCQTAAARIERHSEEPPPESE